MSFSFKLSLMLAVTFTLFVGSNFIFAQWNAPSGTPSAGNNVSAPLNTSATDQVKTGGLSIDTLSVVGKAYVQGNNAAAAPSGLLDLEVEGTIGAFEFCDESGNNCFSAADARNAIDAAAGFTIYTVFAKDYFWGGAKWFGAASKQRVSVAKASCTAGDIAIAGRHLSFGSEISWANTYTQVIDGYNALSPEYFDAQGIVWGDPSHPTYHYKKVWNDYNRRGSRGSYVGSEVKCIHLN